MSHFTKVQTEFIHRHILIEVLRELNYQVNEKTTKVKGYSGSTQNVDFIVKLNNSYDIGFVKGKDGKFSLVADWWGVKGVSKKGIIAEIKQKYALGVVKQEMEKKGYQMVSTQNMEDKTIKVTWRQW